jgi:predicted DNA-binding protein
MENLVRLVVIVPLATRKRLKTASQERGHTMSYLAKMIIEEALEKAPLKKRKKKDVA